MSLLAVYGLRSGEISRLLLSDFDWRLETFTVNHSKRGGAQKYPLQREVGDAILGIHPEGAPAALLPESVPHAETTLPKHRVQQPLAHHEYKNAMRQASDAGGADRTVCGTRVPLICWSKAHP